jgi:hypothetical protein
LSDKQDEQIRLLEEILKWTKFAGMKGVRDALSVALDTDQKKIVYHLSDGTRGMVEVGKSAGIASTATISRYWGSWSKQCFGEFVSVKGGDRFKRTFDLEELAIEIPSIRQNSKEQEEKPQLLRNNSLKTK